MRSIPTLLGAALVVISIAAPAGAQTAPETPPPPEPPPSTTDEPRIPERRFEIAPLRSTADLVEIPTEPAHCWPHLAAANVLVANVLIWAWSRFVTKRDWAQLSLESWRDNLDGPWTFDRNHFDSNQFAHPYHGNLSFTAGRAAGLGFWASTPYPIVMSTLWELFGETERPSINDAITTPIGGTFLGEVLFRLSQLMLDAGGSRPSLWWELAAGAVTPMNGWTRLVAGDRFRSRDEARIPAHIELAVGASFGGTGEVAGQATRSGGYGFLQTRVTHGLPVPGWELRRPFDHFDFAAGVVIANTPWVQLTVRGLMLGDDYGGGLSRGFWGLWGVFEALAPPVFRTSTSALAFGTTYQWAWANGMALNTTTLAGLGFGAGGPHRTTDGHFGLDTFALAEVRIFAADRGVLSMSYRQHFIGGDVSEDAHGSELIGHLTTSARVRIIEGHSLGVDVLWGFRHATFGGGLPDANDRFAQAVGMYAWSPDGSLPSGLAVAR